MLKGLKKEPLQEKDTAQKNIAVSGFRHTFLRDQTTRNTLITMCRWAGFFAWTGDKEQQILQNFMKRILCNCGIWPATSEKGAPIGSKDEDFINKLGELQ